MPVFGGSDEGELVVRAVQHGGVVTFRVDLQGIGVSGTLAGDHFVQTSPKVDVLMDKSDYFGFQALDDGGSDPDGGDTVEQLTRLLYKAADAGVDFKVVALTTNHSLTGPSPYTDPLFGHVLTDDAGTPIIITSSSADIREQLTELWFAPGIGLGFTEMPYEAFRTALSPPLINQPPLAGFLRSDASLEFIMMTGDEESGVNFAPPNSDAFPANYYYQFFVGIKGSQHLDQMTVNIASYLYDFSCLGPGFTQKTRLTDMITWTEGSKAEFCDPNWSASFEPLRAALFTARSRFQLSGLPDSSSITVTINGASIDPIDGRGNPVWTYESPNNWVRFELNAAPQPGASIDVNYSLLCP